VATKKEEYFKSTPVLDNRLGQLIKYFDDQIETGSGESMKYLVENDNDIEILKNVIPLRFEQYVLPYFDKNCSIEAVDKLLNTNPETPVMHNWLNPMRAIMGTIAAKLVHNPEFERLLTIYGEKLRDANPAYKKEFEDLKTLLKN
jgi:hypothetical protein